MEQEEVKAGTNVKRPLVRVQVTTAPTMVEDVATKIGEFLVEQGYELIEQSWPRPGQHDPNESRVFLTVR